MSLKNYSNLCFLTFVLSFSIVSRRGTKSDRNPEHVEGWFAFWAKTRGNRCASHLLVGWRWSSPKCVGAGFTSHKTQDLQCAEGNELEGAALETVAGECSRMPWRFRKCHLEPAVCFSIEEPFHFISRQERAQAVSTDTRAPRVIRANQPLPSCTFWVPVRCPVSSPQAAHCLTNAKASRRMPLSRGSRSDVQTRENTPQALSKNKWKVSIPVKYRPRET